MGRVADWWSNRRLGGDWQVPISSVQGYRPVGGFLVGSTESLEFVPNRFEALIGARPWTSPVAEIEQVTLGRRTLRIRGAGATRTLFTNRPGNVREKLGPLLR